MENQQEPGGARQGNFINYYSFNPPAQRLVHLPTDLIDVVKSKVGKCVALDVGCNSGDLTCGLYEHLNKGKDQMVNLLGVDVDSELIEVANRDHDESVKAGNVQFRTLDLMADDNVVNQVLSDFLNIHNVEQFDVIFCFSVSMWIHLNHGDEGLSKFFQTLSKWCRFLILEPQPWKCYRTASRRMRKLKQPDFEHLKLMKPQSEDDLQEFIEQLCCDNGFKRVEVFGQTENWKRRIILYQRRP